MKTLINKWNPLIRITAPEIIEEDLYYTLNGENIYLKDNWTLVEGIPGWTLVEDEPTCKTCVFYENNCPFIRGKFVPYPSRVCKDYTYSKHKEVTNGNARKQK